MGKVLNPPPNWPPPPAGWFPPSGWRPDPSWGPVPQGWELYVDGPEPQQPSAHRELQSRRRSSTRGRKWEVATSWVSTLTAVAALLLSVVTYVQVNGETNVHMVMPRVIRISAASPGGLQSIYIQPSFTATKRTDHPAILVNMSLLVEPQASGEDMPLFVWHEVVELAQSEADATVLRTRVSDPVPLLVFGSESVSPTIWFLPTGANPPIRAGTLRATLLVEWQGRPSIVRDLCVDVSQEAVGALADSTQAPIHRFIKYPSSECYFFYA
jgi:hypothetical protein